MLGGLIGAVLAIVLYFVGFVAAISSVVAVMVGAKLYQKFGGKPNGTMVVIVSLTSLVCVMLSVVVIYVFVAYAAAVDAGVSMGACISVPNADAGGRVRRTFLERFCMDGRLHRGWNRPGNF